MYEVTALEMPFKSQEKNLSYLVHLLLNQKQDFQLDPKCYSLDVATRECWLFMETNWGLKSLHMNVPTLRIFKRVIYEAQGKNVLYNGEVREAPCLPSNPAWYLGGELVSMCHLCDAIQIPYFVMYMCTFAQIFEGKIRMRIIHGYNDHVPRV